jgi:DNA-binding Lrp family transcriptional regulator
MDAIDRKILGVLQQDASLSVAEIGNRVGYRPRRAGSASRSSKPRA